jgi:ATP-dependent helicase HrpA
VLAAVDHLLAFHGGPVRDPRAWEELSGRVRADLEATVLDVVTRVGEALGALGRIETATAAMSAPALEDSLLDVASQLGGLVYPGFVAATGVDRLDDVVRYLQAVERRLAALGGDVARDRARMARVQTLERAYRRAEAGAPGRRGSRDVRWMLEELRVSLFAQALGTRVPVSEDRVRRAVDALR